VNRPRADADGETLSRANSATNWDRRSNGLGGRVTAPPSLAIELVPGMDKVPQAAWDALVPPDDPFCTWAFLHALEASCSACSRTGWQPAHVLVRAGDRVVGAAPAYVKGNSYGEYIFDWGWAEASQQARIPYYPKVLSAVPFTPATGRRLLVHPDANETEIEAAIWAGLRHLADAADASGIHILFLTESEQGAVAAADTTVIPRLTHQYHWTNDGYADFDEWIGRFRAKVRKETRRERRAPADLGAQVHVRSGAELEPADWAAMEGFYRGTVEKKWSNAYLTPDFFARARTDLAHLALGIIAIDGTGARVAGSLCFQRGGHLFGRYWGCVPGWERLHFELCYHRPIELCIDRGWTRFEAGAQGSHKIKRGLLPSPTWSVHRLHHQGLSDAIRDFCRREALAHMKQMAGLAAHGPFRRDG
jgi:uncharacterized protein